MKKVFLSPSNQDANTWVTGNTNEQIQAEAFADKLEKLLEKQGVEVVRADTVTPTHRIDYAKGCDLYIPLHTNAFDGNVRGCRLFVYNSKTTTALAAKNDKAMKALGAEIEKLGMTPNVRYYYDFANWFELTNASKNGIPAVYSESIFHDNKADCEWYFSHVDEFAEAYAKGICAYLGVKYSATQTQTNTQTNTQTDNIFRVQVGAFRKEEYAEAMRAKINKAGYDAFVVRVGDLYKVQVGAFKNRSYAENLMTKLKALGYDAFITGGTVKKTVDELAKEVIKGYWGSGKEREDRLTAAGYDYKAVQARVNELM